MEIKLAVSRIQKAATVQCHVQHGAVPRAAWCGAACSMVQYHVERGAVLRAAWCSTMWSMVQCHVQLQWGDPVQQNSLGHEKVIP